MTARRAGIVVAAVALSTAAAVLVHRSKSSRDEPPETASEVTVKLGKVIRTTLHAYVTGFGSVVAEPATAQRPPASAKIGSPVAGLLAEAQAVEGRQTVKGAVLFKLDSRVADVQVEKARQALEFAQVAFERQQKLMGIGGTSKRLYEETEQHLRSARYELANASAQRALLVIRAPIAGTVVRVNAKPGDAVDPASPLAEVVDLNRLVVSAKIRTSEVGALRPGQRVELSPGRPEAPSVEVPGAPVAALVSFIGADVDTSNDTVTVRATPASSASLRPGQFLRLRILVEEHRDRLAVPAESLLVEAGGASAAIVVVAGDVATRRPVKPGIRDGGLVEVEGAGVEEGTPIVVGGAYGVPDGTRVRPVAP